MFFERSFKGDKWNLKPASQVKGLGESKRLPSLKDWRLCPSILSVQCHGVGNLPRTVSLIAIVPWHPGMQAPQLPDPGNQGASSVWQPQNLGSRHKNQGSRHIWSFPPGDTGVQQRVNAKIPPIIWGLWKKLLSAPSCVPNKNPTLQLTVKMISFIHRKIEHLGLLPFVVPWGWQLFKKYFSVIYCIMRPMNISSVGIQCQIM